MDTGGSQVIKNTAAQQLADVQKSHPDELFNLLTRVIPFLSVKQWDTRIAAAKALGGIIENAEKYDPNSDEAFVNAEGDGTAANGPSVKEERRDSSAAFDAEDLLQLDSLDIASILQYGKKLLGSAGREYDWHLASLSPAERLAEQKRNLKQRLGLAGEYLEDDLYNEADLSINPKLRGLPTPKLDTSSSTLSQQNSFTSPMYSTMSPHDVPPTPSDETGLSKRQLNALKRKHKLQAKAGPNKVRIVDLSTRRPSTETPQTPLVPEPYAIKAEPNSDDPSGQILDYFSTDRTNGDDDTKVVSEFKGPAIAEKSLLEVETGDEGSRWPYEHVCEFLTVDLFDPNWETRHGAAMGIREVVRVHGAGAGRVRGKTKHQNDELNRRWLDDLACRLCCVFMLDRFGDYVSDNVVAPIRETIGQTLGALLVHLPPQSVSSVYRILYRLVIQEESDRAFTKRIWEVCHGGMLGLKYLVAIRNDLLLQDNDLIDGVIQAVMKGLGDIDDDVRAVSAATLVPIAKEFVDLRPHALNSLITIVWDCLAELRDDLSASTGSVMDLLAKLCSFPEVLEAMKKNASVDTEHSFAMLVPRLYPFLRHTITSVRSAVLRALLTFLQIEGDGTKGWVNGRILRLLFQNLLMERNDTVLKLSLQVWVALAESLGGKDPNRFAEEFGPHVADLITLTLHPIGVSRFPFPMDRSLIMRPSGQMYAPPAQPLRKVSPSTGEHVAKRRKKFEKKDELPPSHNVDGPMMSGDVDLVGADILIRSRIYAAQGIGKAMSLWPRVSCRATFDSLLLPHVDSPFSTTQLTVSILLEQFAIALMEHDAVSASFALPLHSAVENERPPIYREMVSFVQIVRSQCQSLANTFRDIGKVPSSKIPMLVPVVQGDPDAGPDAFSLAFADKFITEDFERLKKSLAPAQRMLSAQALTDARQCAVQAIDEAKKFKDVQDIRVIAAAAGAMVAFKEIPPRPSHLIKGIMDSVKTEENIELQRRSAHAIASLIEQLVLAGRNKIVEKIVSNLVKFTCQDTSETPEFLYNASHETAVLSLRKEEDRADHPDQAKFDQDARAAKIQRRGSKEALEQLLHIFKGEALEKIPTLRSIIELPLHRTFDADIPTNITSSDSTLGQEVVDGLSVIRTLAPKLDPSLHAFVIDQFPLIIKALSCKLSVFRYAAAKCFATICSVISNVAMTIFVEKILPAINNALDLFSRQGAIECIYHLIHVMEDRILPYVIFLIVPVLGRMSDADNDVRLIATTSFATLVKLVPLEAGIPDPPGMSEDLLKGRERERKFISQMLDPSKVEPFEIPVAIKAELRSYQQEGVNWLAFLNRYHLHGILCDDMGLGKTLQTLCIVASDHHMRAEEYAKTSSPDVRKLPSLIVCPPTLSGHWQQEIKTYAPFLSCLAYVGSPVDRSRLRPELGKTDIVITSYDICRNDIDIFASFNWNYCVLDEGHLIKNPKAKISMSVKRLSSNHRLILSGTPIQNNVLELWSLFDFLMPGFLGTEKVFSERFSKPIAASRFQKSSSKEQEAGALAIEALHKQVLPFLLRRLKEEVLDDLPPKILQNYYCDLSELQKKLFEDFAKKEAKNIAEQATSGDKEAKQHIFQALQYMRKLCNSPALVMKETHKQYAEIQKLLAKDHSKITDPIHAPKLMALRDLLVDCGIGVEAPHGEINYVSQHRALIFCQMKEMLDIVQNDVLKKMLPSAQYLRLDGSVEANKRQDIVNKFNGDPSFDVLLLTTSVGGLGLNLTGADTVIFVEHDWNPQKDMQAMDRAHRIGQKKVVNVYRLVTRGTLEEKILR